ncbi:hypothetical protein OKW21_004986 [Catalinimonas alkaloidigena]|uniref:nucleoside-diphosphate sugar epimerase/dehydratase n=1 Tax=Catalinimonas alkaloidigena TaxID=1075417 RepID=UPI002405ED13|nr:hypothetical protein [Catalinimonas alkaloidigena]MDF9799723.1 hypothetical protein [Catalinimonas alkaloidigena]
MGRVKSAYSKVCILILALPDVFAFGIWLSLGTALQSTVLLTDIEFTYILTLLWMCASGFSGLYNPPQLVSWPRLSLALTKALTVELLAGSMLYYLLPGMELRPDVFLLFCCWLAAVSLGSRMALLRLYRGRRKGDGTGFIILGYTPEARLLQRHLKRVGKHHRFLGFFDDRSQGAYIRGRMVDVTDFCRNHKVDAIYICGEGASQLGGLYDFANQHYIYLYFLMPGLKYQAGPLDHIDLTEGLSLIGYQPSRRRQWRKKWLALRLNRRRLVAATH